jgi:heat shock protein HslJ
MGKETNDRSSVKNPWAAVGARLSIRAIAVSACGGARAHPLRDTAWELVSLGGSEPIPGTTIALKCAADEISGSAGCNTCGGRYEAAQETLSLSGVYATEWACMEPEGAMAQERAYLDASDADVGAGLVTAPAI